MDEVYIIRGHGGILKSKFTLKEGQYVIFPTQCGLPINMNVGVHPSIQRILQNKNAIWRYTKHNMTHNVPSIIRKPVLVRPGQNAFNSFVMMYNKRNEPNCRIYNQRTGVYRLSNRKYLGGKGTTQKISSIIGNKPGIYWIDACRTTPTITNYTAIRMLNNIWQNRNVNVPNWLKNMRLSENLLMRNHTRKRKTMNKSNVNRNVNMNC